MQRYIEGKYLPARPPIAVTWLLALSMAVWDWPSWLLGILWFVLAFLWFAFFWWAWKARPLTYRDGRFLETDE